MIPGIIYGVGPDKTNLSIRVMMPVKPLNKLVRDLKHSFENTVHAVKLDDGSEYIVTPRQLQIDPCTYCVVRTVCCTCSQSCSVHVIIDLLFYIPCCTDTVSISQHILIFIRYYEISCVPVLWVTVMLALPVW